MRRSRSSTRLVCGLLAIAAAACRGSGRPENLPTLTTAAETRRLTAADAARGYPVRMRGVVTSYGHERYAYYLQDATGGVRVDPGTGRGHPNEIADQIEVLGITGVEAGSPIVIEPRSTWTAQAALPPPRPSSVARVARGDDVGWRVEAAGITREVATDRGTLTFDLVNGASTVAVEIIGAPPEAASRLASGTRVRLRGVAAQPTSERSRPRLYAATLDDVTVVGTPAALAEPRPTGGGAPPAITRVAEIRALGPEDAARGLRVRLRGVVTFYIAPLLFVQDDTAGVYVRLVEHQDLEAGRLVEVSGVTGPGQFAPIVDRAQIRSLGRAPLPSPEKVTAARLLSGQMDSQWVELDDVTVRSLEGDHLHVAAGDRQLSVWLRVPPDQPPPADLIGARVSLEGVANTFFNLKRQVVGAGLNVPSRRFVRITQPAPDPAALPVTPIDRILLFSPAGDPTRPVRVRGTVVLARPDRTVYVQDATGSARVQVAGDAGALRPGDQVEVFGFPAPHDYAPHVEDARVTVLGEAPLGPPRPVTVAAIMSGEHDLEWVTVSGRLLDQVRSGGEIVLSLQSAQTVFTAIVPGRVPLAVRAGSLLELRGVASLQLDEIRQENVQRQILGFRMLLRSPEDVVVVEAPPWLDLRRTAMLIALVAVVGFLWHRLQVMKVRAGFEAVASERTRLSREIHDTLQQRFVALLQMLDRGALARAGLPEDARGHLAEAHAVLRGCMAEARRLVRDLRTPALDRSDLAHALEDVVRQLTNETGPAITFEATGPARPLSEAVETHLLRIGQEALVNAIRHARARRVDIALTFSDTAVTLVVRDDGCGFSGDGATEAEHFGLLGMRERALQIRGRLDVTSRPGAGTEIRVGVPLPS